MENKLKTHIVYLHYSECGSILYYIGCSMSKSRAYDVWMRSKKWKEAYKKYGLKVSIIRRRYSSISALKLEKKLIAEQVDNPHLCNQKNGRKPKLPFAQMEIGDSFFYDKNPLSSAMSWVVHNNSEAKFSTRKEGKGYRIWRIK